MTTKTGKAKLAREILAQNPSVTANRTLAKILLNKYPMVYNDLEDARKYIRSVCGANGKSSKNEYHATFHERLAKLRAECNVEVEKQEDKTPYTFTKHHNKALVISDLHYPYTDMDALDLALEYGYNKGVDCVIINGDFEDFATISRFLSKPNEMSVIETLEGARYLLDYIKSSLGVKVVYHEGNHSTRLEQYLIRQAPQLWGLSGTSLSEQLQLKDKGIDHVPDYRYMKFGYLNIAHGHHIVKGIFAPVNAARGVFTKTNTSTMIGHVHRTSEHIETDMNGKVIGCYSTGCLTTVRPDYNPQVSKHNQGFAFVEKDPKTGEFEVDNKKIINNKIK